MVWLWRSRSKPSLTGWCAGALTIYCTREEARGRPPLAHVVGRPRPGSHLYVCGPASLRSDVHSLAEQQGWPNGNVHCESFEPDEANATDQPFTVYLAKREAEVEVPVGTTILDALIDAGISVSYDCKSGSCGTCTVRVLDGEPIHRDALYSRADQATNGWIRICTSRVRGNRLVIDL